MVKIVFIGAGSSIFVKNVLGDCLQTPVLADSEMVLVDIDVNQTDTKTGQMERHNTGRRLMS